MMPWIGGGAFAGPEWLLTLLLRATVMLLVVCAAAIALRRASASTRHVVWGAGVIALLVLPLLSLLVPWRLELLPAAPSNDEPLAAVALPTSAPAPSRVATLPSDPTGPVEVPPRTAVITAPAASEAEVLPAPTRSFALWQVVALVWAAGALAALGPVAAGAFSLRRILRRAEPLTASDWTRPLYEAADRLDLARAPRLLSSSDVALPFACGVVRPAVVLPATASEWTEERRRAVLMHELAHIRRGDVGVNLLARIVSGLYWFHPLAWFAAARVRAESERACDDMVLSVGTRASDYADHLLDMVRFAGRSRTPAVVLPMARRREFEGRLLAILEAGVPRRPVSRIRLAAVAVITAAFAVPVAALAPRSTDSDKVEYDVVTTSDAFEAASNAAQPPQPSQPGTPSPSPSESQSQSRSQSQAPSPSRSESPSQSQAQSPSDEPASMPATDLATERFDDAWIVDAIDKFASAAASSAAMALAGTPPDTQLIPALIRSLSDESAEVRAAAAEGLGRAGATAAVAPLMQRLVQDDSEAVRRAAAWALAIIGDSEAVPALASAAHNDSTVTVRALSVWAVARFSGDLAVTAASAALADSASEVREAGAWALGSMGLDEAPDALVAFADRAGNGEDRVAAIWALGQIGDERAAPALQKVLVQSDDGEVTRAAIWAIGRIGGEASEAALIRALEHEDPDVRAAAIHALTGRGVDPWPWPWPIPNPW